MQKGKLFKVPPLLICFHLKLILQVLLVLVLLVLLGSLDLQVLVLLVSLDIQVVFFPSMQEELLYLIYELKRDMVLIFYPYILLFPTLPPFLLISTLPQQQCKLRHRLGPPTLTRCQLQIIIPPLLVLLQVSLVLVNLCIKPQLFSKQLKFLRVFYPFLLSSTLPQQQCKLRHRLGPPRITNRLGHSWLVPIPDPPRQFILKRLLTRIILLKLQLGISYFF